MDFKDLIFINEKRYYKIKMDSKEYLEHTIPYSFKHRNIEIFENSWTKITLSILNYLDEISSVDTKELLKLKYWWSNKEPFSKVKKTNFRKFKDIYINLNHSAHHARLQIQMLLNVYKIPLNECVMIIKKLPKAEKESIRAYFKSVTIKQFEQYLIINQISKVNSDIIIKNIDSLSAVLEKMQTGYDNIWLFDYYYIYENLEKKIIEYIKNKHYTSKNLKALEKSLYYMSDFYKNRSFYTKLPFDKINKTHRDILITEIEILFNALSSNIITNSKLYSRIRLIHDEFFEEIEVLNNINDFYMLAMLLLKNRYYFEKPFISKNKDHMMNKEELLLKYIYSQDVFKIENLNNYINKMHLKKPDTYLDLILSISLEYVQVEKGKMINKEIINIEPSTIEKVKEYLLFYIRSFGEIDSLKYNGYNALPKIEYQWDKYFLMGFINSYLYNDFKIEYKSRSYSNIEYIICENQ